MSLFEGLRYVSGAGKRALVGHRTDDPYIGNPMSEFAVQLRNDGPRSLEWFVDGRIVRLEFCADVQAAVDPVSRSLVVIGHGCGSLDGAAPPNNGLVIDELGRQSCNLAAPAWIESATGPAGARIKPDGLAALEVVDGRVEIWISYWDGEWMERRPFSPGHGEWGPVSEHMRTR